MLENRVRDITTTGGTGSITLAQTPPAGCQAFGASGIPSGSKVRYCETDGTNWEIWEGIFTTGPDTLTKVTLESSSTGSAISWTGGTAKTVFNLPSARDLVYQYISYLGTTGGTANAQTLTPGCRLLAYHYGYFFRATIGLGNTGATTFAISGLGPRNVKRYGPGGLIALGGGELVTGNTHSFFDDGTQIIVLDPAISWPTGAGIMTAVSTTQIKFGTKNGNWVMNNGVLRPIGASGIVAGNTGVYVNGVASQNLAATTAYLVTVFDLTGTPTIDFKSTLPHAPSASLFNLGTEIWNSDDTRSVVGMLYTDASSHFIDNAAIRTVASWFNRQAKGISGGGTGGAVTASGSPVELSTNARVSAVVWADGGIFLGLNGYATNNTSPNACAASIGRNGATPIIANSPQAEVAGTNYSVSLGQTTPDTGFTEGYNYWTALGNVGGGTGTYFVGLTGEVWS